MKKHILDLTVRSVEHVHERYVLLKLTIDDPLPAMLPGQFLEVRVDGSPSTFLRRPISINFVDRESNELWLLVACVGDGTRRLAQLHAGEILNCVLPLGRGFDVGTGETCCDAPTPSRKGRRALLVGGGVGVAPLLFLGKVLRDAGTEVTFLLGARTGADLLLLDEFGRYGRVLVTTEDGSMGERGFVTQHSVLRKEQFDIIQCCGPTPMMRAVVDYAYETDTRCQVSLENMMACGLGACLCCVEKIRDKGDNGQCSMDNGQCSTDNGQWHNVCVCKDGPVFDKEELLWHD